MVNFLDDDTHTSETHLIKCSRSLDIAKLEKVNEIAHLIARGKIEISEAANRLEEIKNSPPTWGIKMTLLGYVLSSAFVAPLFFNGSWTDCWVSGIFGLGGKYIYIFKEYYYFKKKIIKIVIYFF